MPNLGHSIYFSVVYFLYLIFLKVSGWLFALWLVVPDAPIGFIMYFQGGTFIGKVVDLKKHFLDFKILGLAFKHVVGAEGLFPVSFFPVLWTDFVLEMEQSQRNRAKDSCHDATGFVELGIYLFSMSGSKPNRSTVFSFMFSRS